MTIDKKQIELIIEQVMEKLTVSETRTSQDTPGAKDTPHNKGEHGVFQEMEDAIQAAVAAHQQLLLLPLETREKNNPGDTGCGLGQS